MPDPIIPDTPPTPDPVVDPPAVPAVVPEARAVKCPECGCEHKDNVIVKASEKLPAMQGELAAVKRDLAAEKTKVVPVPDPAPTPAAKKRKGMLFAKKRNRAA